MDRLGTKVGTLNEKTKCFKDFLKLKLEMLHDEESDNRLLRNNSPKRYSKKAEGKRDSFIKKDGKIFVIKEWDGEEVEEEEDKEAAFSIRPGSTPRRLPKRNIQGT